MKGETGKDDLWNDVPQREGEPSRGPESSWAGSTTDDRDAPFGSETDDVPRFVPDMETDSAGSADFSEDTGATEHRGLWKALFALGVGCLSVNLILGAVLLSMTSLGVASCSRSCSSDNPVNDSREDASFIAALETNGRDLATFDALSGAIDSLYKHELENLGGADAERLYTPSQLRNAIEDGSWPKEPAGYGDTSSAYSPQLWVRLAELAQDYLEGATGEKWEIVDFSYPFPGDGSLFSRGVRGEYDSADTRLVCTEGDDLGLYVEVSHYRWGREAEFSNNLERVRSYYEDSKRELSRIGEWDEVKGRQWVLSNGDLYLWCTGQDDELCDPERFVEVANKIAARMEERSYMDVYLLAGDAPVMLSYYPLSYDFPNKRPVEETDIQDANERLAKARYALSIEHAYGDVLLSGYYTQDEPITLDNLRGNLSPSMSSYSSTYVSWYGPSKEGKYDKQMAQDVAQTWDIDVKDVVAFTEWDHFDGDTSVDVWVIVPRGTVSETPRAFCDEVNALNDMVWNKIEPSSIEGQVRCRLKVSVIEPEGIRTPAGETCDFAEFRAAMRKDPQSMASYSAEVVLQATPGTTRWEDEAEPYVDSVERNEVGGSIPQTRAWRYGVE